MSKRLNRAKCRLCADIIISRYQHDFVGCKCGEIFIDGGNSYWRAGAKDFNNLLRYRNRKWVSEKDWLPIKIVKKTLRQKIVKFFGEVFA